MWFDCTKAALKKLKIVYNNSLRRFMFLPWRNGATKMFVNLGIHCFDEMLRIFVFRFRPRVTASHNQLIFCLCSALQCLFKTMGMVEQLITYIVIKYKVNAIIYLMNLLHANLYLIHFVSILFNCIVIFFIHCFNMDQESAINAYTYKH